MTILLNTVKGGYKMIFYSKEFTNKTGYNKQRRELIKQIKQHFNVKGRLNLPHNVIILQFKTSNGDWVSYTDSSYNAEAYADWQGVKRLITLNLSTK